MRFDRASWPAILTYFPVRIFPENPAISCLTGNEQRDDDLPDLYFAGCGPQAIPAYYG
jgi:hypothetical protein